MQYLFPECKLPVREMKKKAKQVPSISSTRKLWLAMVGRIYYPPMPGK